MRFIKKILFVMLLLLTPVLVSAQSKLTGKVVDASGQPVIGASVVQKGTTIGTVTDMDGSFTLNVSNKCILQVSFVGYEKAIIDVDGQRTLAITLKESSQSLNEIVVVGYGTQKKATLTGAVEQVSKETFESRAVTNVGLALQGATPGLTVSRSSSRPGNEGISFQIRGITSINGGSPLVVIDGVPALNYESFQNMNMDDIANISVLKDGAASIYGAKAANGVILVTTKKGKGKTRVDYNFNTRFTTNGITGYSPNMAQYATMWLEANKEEKIPNWWCWLTQESMQRMQKMEPGIYHTTAWGDIFLDNSSRVDEMFARRYSYQNNVSLSGSSEKSDYRVSALYSDNQGNLATAYDGQKQFDLRLNYGIQVNKRVRLETAASLVKTDTRSPSTGLDASLYGQEAPVFPAKNPYGEWYADYGTVGDRNPAAATSDGGRNNVSSMTTRLDVKAIVDIWKGLSFEGMASFQNEEYRQEQWVIPVLCYDWFGNPCKSYISSTIQSTSNPGYKSVANNNFYQYYSALLKYNKSFGKHNFSAMAGINAEKSQNKNLSASRVKFVDNGVEDLNLADATTQLNSGGKSHNGTYSYITRLTYNYADKYLAELMGRRDGNSKFAPGYRFQNYCSYSLGWVFTQESFMNFITSVVDFGKIRYNYGSSGNDVGLGNYDYVSAINLGTTVLGSPAAYQVSSSLNNSGLISKTRTWERVEQKNIGLDLNFLNSRLTSSFDYFIKDNKHMLSSVTYPSVLGGSAPKTNSGHLRVKGWEVSLSWRDHVKDFSYFATFNISDTRSKLESLQGADTYTAGKNNVNGRPLNSWYLYKTDGFFKNQDEVDTYYAKYGTDGDLTKLPSGGNTALRPGDTKKVDISNDGTISANGSKSSDLVYKGDGNAHYNFGLTLGGSWKGFDLSAMFQGVLSQKIMRNGWMSYPFNTTYTNQNPTFLGKTWTADRPNAKYPRLTTYTDRSAWNYANNDFMLQNNRYIRLKSLIIGYTIPGIITRKVNVEKVRLYFSGNDLWEATTIKDGFDPEMGETSQNAGYPFARTWSFGVNVTF